MSVIVFVMLNENEMLLSNDAGQEQEQESREYKHDAADDTAATVSLASLAIIPLVLHSLIGIFVSNLL